MIKVLSINFYQLQCKVRNKYPTTEPCDIIKLCIELNTSESIQLEKLRLPATE